VRTRAGLKAGARSSKSYPHFHPAPEATTTVTIAASAEAAR
jgi:hypothetical protein